MHAPLHSQPTAQIALDSRLPLPLMTLTPSQRHLLVGLRVFLALLSLVAIYDFAVSLG